MVVKSKIIENKVPYKFKKIFVKSFIQLNIIIYIYYLLIIHV